MRQPLDQFADRLVRNGEVPEFIRGLIEKITEVAIQATRQKPMRRLIDKKPLRIGRDA
jgi:hypothetical protein